MCWFFASIKAWHSWKIGFDSFFLSDDVVKFYETAIKTFLPLDELRTMELPPNLHIEHNYTRFHPDTDTMFGGKSAFPEQSCIVTGITSRKKYSGFVAERRREEIHEDFKPK